MSEADAPAVAGHFPDDGIPVLTEVVDAALLPAIEPTPHEADDKESVEGPPSLAMFPELEADAGRVAAPEPAAPTFAANLIEAPVERLDGTPAESHPADPQAAVAADTPVEAPMATTLEEPLESSNAARYAAFSEAPEPKGHALAQSGPNEQQAPSRPLSQALPQHETPYAERYAARYAALHQVPPVVLVVPPAEAQLQALPPAPIDVAQIAPAAGDLVAPESPSEIETRIFEAIAARIDRLLEQRLETIVPGVVEAALFGIQAGMTASVKQALREAVEQAVRHEFERRANPE